MPKSKLTILLLLSLTLAASGCINNIGGGDNQSNQVKIEEGDTLVYNLSGTEELEEIRTARLEFTEISSSVYRSQISTGNTETVTNYTIDRESLKIKGKDSRVPSTGPANLMFFASSIATLTNTSTAKIRSMMENGENITVSNEGNLWRGEETEINGFKAYEILSDQGHQDTEIFVLGSEPYPTVRYRSENFRINLESIENEDSDSTEKELKQNQNPNDSSGTLTQEEVESAQDDVNVDVVDISPKNPKVGGEQELMVTIENNYRKDVKTEAELYADGARKDKIEDIEIQSGGVKTVRLYWKPNSKGEKRLSVYTSFGSYSEKITSGRIIDDFEDGNLLEYSTVSNAGEASVYSDKSYEGSSSMRIKSTGDWHVVYSETGLDNYPSIGDTFDFWANEGYNAASYGMIFAGDGNGQNYGVRLSATNDVFQIVKDQDGNSANILESTSVSMDEDAWYRVKIEWSQRGLMTATLYDSNGYRKKQISVSDSSYSQGGIGYMINGNNGDEGLAYIDQVSEK